MVAGDLLLFVFALWLMLFLRYGVIPDGYIFYLHLAPFSLLFIVWLFVFFVAGLYEKHTLLLRSRVSNLVLRTEAFNSFLAVIFFYFVPYFGIAPKANLFIYLFISVALILAWRIYGYPLVSAREKQDAIIIGEGAELRELVAEINQNPRYGIRFIASIDANDIGANHTGKSIAEQIAGGGVTLVALDLENKKIEPILPYLYELMWKRVRFIDIHRLYEDIFDRVPLSLVKYSWFMEQVSASLDGSFNMLKRAVDAIFSFIFGLISLLFYPFIILAIKLDDGGPLFIFQERVGERGKIIKIVKFRTMTRDDAGLARDKKNNKPTRVGPFLRKSRLDELPQFWNVFRGDLSLVGPRPELPSLAMLYEREVPYYKVRHLLKPGLFGWAQLYHEKHPHHNADVGETRVKLSYDLYYIKHRSLFLDLKIVLKTMKTLLSRSGV